MHVPLVRREPRLEDKGYRGSVHGGFITSDKGSAAIKRYRRRSHFAIYQETITKLIFHVVVHNFRRNTFCTFLASNFIGILNISMKVSCLKSSLIRNVFSNKKLYASNKLLRSDRFVYLLLHEKKRLLIQKRHCVGKIKEKKLHVCNISKFNTLITK